MTTLWKLTPWVIAFVLVCVVVENWGQTDAKIRRQDRLTDSLRAELLVSKHKSDSILAIHRTRAATAEGLSRRAEPLRHKVEALDTLITTPVADTVCREVSGIHELPCSDTTAMVNINRTDAPEIKWRVPLFVVAERTFLIQAGFTLDSAWRAERSARLYSDSIVIPSLQGQLVTASHLIDNQQAAIRLRDQRHGRAWTKYVWFVGGLVVGQFAHIMTPAR